ncbi:MAG TPA: ABC transporter ATP-binding protein, partial [Polyangia bacterium]|nr:ABC transporter ATP-binding protein [Polyangia bacterium]
AVVDIRRPVRIELDYEVLQSRWPLHPNIHVFNDEGVCVFISNDSFFEETRAPRAPGQYRATMEIPGNYLAEGMFSLDLALSTFEPVLVHVHERGALAFQVNDPSEGDSARGTYAGPLPGVTRPQLTWTTTLIDAATTRKAGNS